MKVSGFLQDLFQTVDLLGGKPGQLRGRDVTIEEFLKHGASKIRLELDDQPRVKARLMSTIGKELVAIGDYEEGGELLNDSLTIRLKLLAADDPEIADSHRQLGRLYRLQAKPAEAERELRRAIEILELDEAKNHKDLAGALNDLGLLIKNRDPEQAIKHYLRSQEIESCERP